MKDSLPATFIHVQQQCFNIYGPLNQIGDTFVWLDSWLAVNMSCFTILFMG